MTSAEAFKIGFLLQCASEGLTKEATLQRIKQAGDGLVLGPLAESAVKGTVGVAKDSIGAILKAIPTSLAVLTGVVAPAAGLTGGYALAKMQDDTFAEEDVRKEEELAEYYRALDMLRRSAPQAVANTR